jgi:hypothetical protein
MQHTTHLVKPVFSTTLLGMDGGVDEERGNHSAKGDEFFAGKGSGSRRSRNERRSRPLMDSRTSKSPKPSFPSDRIRSAWPHSYLPHEANTIFVNPDWSDLEAVVRWLEAHPKTAEGIANRQRETFEGGGYVSPAAEMCYWRALVRGWAQAVRLDLRAWANKTKEGVRFEEFVLREKH